MRFFIIISFILLISGCSNVKKTYWCGDHPCINKKERKAYFKKNKVLEIKEVNKKNKKEISDLDKIIKQAHLNEKKRIKDEKILKKEAKLEKKRKIKEQKKLAKLAREEQKKKLKKQKKQVKKTKITNKKSYIKKKPNIQKDKNIQSQIEVTDFEKIVNMIKEKNMSKSYPDINNIPN